MNVTDSDLAVHVHDAEARTAIDANLAKKALTALAAQAVAEDVAVPQGPHATITTTKIADPEVAPVAAKSERRSSPFW